MLSFISQFKAVTSYHKCMNGHSFVLCMQAVQYKFTQATLMVFPGTWPLFIFSPFFKVRSVKKSFSSFSLLYIQHIHPTDPHMIDTVVLLKWVVERHLAYQSRRLRGTLLDRQAALSLAVVHCPSTISNNFSETTGPIVTKFHVEPPELAGT